MPPFWMLLELKMMEVVLTTGAIRGAKLQSDRHHQQTNIQFYRPDALPVTRPTVSEHWGKYGFLTFSVFIGWLILALSVFWVTQMPHIISLDFVLFVLLADANFNQNTVFINNWHDLPSQKFSFGVLDFCLSNLWKNRLVKRNRYAIY